MALNHSPKIVTNGLVFYYDQNNPKSYKGPAMQNLLTQLNSNYGSTPSTATGRSYSGGVQFMDIPQLGYTRVAVTNIQNNYTSFLPNSNDCCPSPHTYYGNFVVTPSTLYTYAIVYKCLSGYTNGNYMYRYEYTASNGAYVTEAGVHDTNKRIHLGDNWYWAWNTFTTQPTTNWIMYAGSYYYRYSPINDQLMIAKIMITQGDYTQLHPRYWPEVNTSRTPSNVLSDLTNVNTANVNSLAYSSNSVFSFNGSSSYIDTNVTPNKDQGTISAFFKMDTLRDYNTIFDNSLGANDWECWVYATGQITFRTNADSTDIRLDKTGLLANVWYNVTITWTTTGAVMYINGEFAAEDTSATGRLQPSILGIGGANAGNTKMQGQIPNFMVYNRALTANEVRQNFNALRGRYGI